MDPKPEMSAREASWHVHLAGMRASAEAKKKGGNIDAIEALASATAGPRMIAGMPIYPATEGTVFTLRRIAREFNAWADGIEMPRAGAGQPNGHRELLELGLSTLTFMDSLAVWTALDAEGIEPLIVRAETLIFRVEIEIQRQLEDHFTREMARISELSGSDEGTPEKKPTLPAEHGNLAGTENPPTGAD